MAVSLSAEARCCWCGEAFRRITPEKPWMCWTKACYDRVAPWALVTYQTTKKGVVKCNDNGTPLIEEWLSCPTPKQVEFFELQQRVSYALFGGLKGVTKSYALRWGAYRECARIPNLRVLLLRRTYGELESTHLLEMPLDAQKLAPLGAQFKQGDREFWLHGTGSLIKAGHCETESDIAKFLSTQWDLIIFDEIVTFTLHMFLAIVSCARSVKPQVIAEGGAKVWGGTNPGGRGAVWVPDLFIYKSPDSEQFPHYVAEQWGYVPAKLEDNPYMEIGYRQKLMNLPPMLRRLWLDGDWTAFEGQFFDFQARHTVVPEDRRLLAQGRTVGESVQWHVRDDLGIAA